MWGACGLTVSKNVIAFAIFADPFSCGTSNRPNASLALYTAATETDTNRQTKKAQAEELATIPIPTPDRLSLRTRKREREDKLTNQAHAYATQRQHGYCSS